MEEEELSLTGPGRWLCSQKTDFLCQVPTSKWLPSRSLQQCSLPLLRPDLVTLGKQVTSA